MLSGTDSVALKLLCLRCNGGGVGGIESIKLWIPFAACKWTEERAMEYELLHPGQLRAILVSPSIGIPEVACQSEHLENFGG